MIGWKPPAKAKRRPPPNAGHARAIAKGIERKEVKAFWQKVSTHDALNLEWCQYFLEHRREYGESSIQVFYALLVAERLGFVFEEDVCE